MLTLYKMLFFKLKKKKKSLLVWGLATEQNEIPAKCDVLLFHSEKPAEPWDRVLERKPHLV